MLGVERWADIRRLHFVEGVGIREIARRTGMDRKTIRRALRADAPPRYTRPPAPSKLDPHREQIQRLLREDPRIRLGRIEELIRADGYTGARTILGDYVREIRPLYGAPARVFGRTVYRPGEIAQVDLMELRAGIPVGFGQTRRAWAVVVCLGYSRAGAAGIVLTKQAPDILWAIGRCLCRLGALPETLVCDREGALHAGEGRPTEPFAAFCGALPVGWRFCEPADPQSKGLIERLNGYIRTSFEPGRAFLGPDDVQSQIDDWFDRRANVRVHRRLRARPTDLLGQEIPLMRPLPSSMPDLDRRMVVRVAPDPYVRVDTCDYSLDPRLVGRRVEVRVGQREVIAHALETGEPACRHRRSFARHREITDPAHLAALRAPRERAPEVERRDLARYDALIPA
jgi:transposase